MKDDVLDTMNEGVTCSVIRMHVIRMERWGAGVETQKNVASSSKLKGKDHVSDNVYVGSCFIQDESRMMS